jgi:hypothetical protein
MIRLNHTAIRFALLTALVSLVAAVPAAADHGKDKDKERHFQARLEGAQETPPIATAATGSFRATLNSAGTELSFELKYADLEGGNATAAHVHFAQKAVAGGVMFFLCGGGGKPACPAGDATVTGTVVAADVVGPAGQGIAAGDFDSVIEAMRDGLGYANVHTTQFPTGEIRGQVKR